MRQLVANRISFCVCRKNNYSQLITVLIVDVKINARHEIGSSLCVQKLRNLFLHKLFLTQSLAPDILCAEIVRIPKHINNIILALFLKNPLLPELRTGAKIVG
jgi:hypothetical protein